MHRLKAIFHNLHTLLLLILVITLIVSACASVTDSYVDSLPVNDDSLFADAHISRSTPRWCHDEQLLLLDALTCVCI